MARASPTAATSALISAASPPAACTAGVGWSRRSLAISWERTSGRCSASPSKDRQGFLNPRHVCHAGLGDRYDNEAPARGSSPSGKTPKSARRLSIPGGQNIPLYRNSDLSYTRSTLARDKGRIAIVTNRGLGCDGRDGVGHEWHCRAASAVSDCHRAYDTTLTASSHGFGCEHTPALEATCEDVRGRTSRVVLTPGVCASSPAVMWRPDRARASAIGRATGAIVHRSPRRARRTR